MLFIQVTAVGRRAQRGADSNAIFQPSELLGAWAAFSDRGKDRLDLKRHKIHVHLLNMLSSKIKQGYGVVATLRDDRELRHCLTLFLLKCSPIPRIARSKAEEWERALPALIGDDVSAQGLAQQRTAAETFVANIADLNGGTLIDGGDEIPKSEFEVGKEAFVMHAEEALLLLVQEAASPTCNSGQPASDDEEEVEAAVEKALENIRRQEEVANERMKLADLAIDPPDDENSASESESDNGTAPPLPEAEDSEAESAARHVEGDGKLTV